MKKISPGIKIIIAPDSFKESLTAREVAEAIEKGCRRVFPEAKLVKIPMADGGEGTVHSLVEATAGEIKEALVSGPLGEKVRAGFGILGDGNTAVIEMAAASGLPLVPLEKRDPMITTTYGTGELIGKALDEGCKTIIVGIGGSATVDGGAGMAQALGVRLLDASGEEIPFGGGGLKKLARIDISRLDPRLKGVKVLVASDVVNPLLGPEGAARIFAPQKGATPEMVEELEKNLGHYAKIICQCLGKDIACLPGGGAAGGLGAGLVAFLEAEIYSGVEVVIETVRLEDHLRDAHLVITGEGKIDGTTLKGKTPIGVARRAKKYSLPVIAVGGSLAEDAHLVYEGGIDALYDIISCPTSLEVAIRQASLLLEEATERALRFLKIGSRIPEFSNNFKGGKQ